MNRIAIVGHPSTKYKDVEKQLNAYGMAKASSSRREAMSVYDIQASLCKANNIADIHEAQREEELTQIIPSSTWQGLALDFLLGNMEQTTVWGWADPSTLPLLNMWHDVDEHTTFLLIYQHPSLALKKALRESANVSPDVLLNNWVAYNSALLAFYLRHPERCYLVHADSFLDEPEVLLEYFETLDVVKTPQQASFSPDTTSEKNTLTLSKYLHQQLIAQHTALALYEELQASSNQPKMSSQEFLVADAWLQLKSLQKEEVRQKTLLETERKIKAEAETSLEEKCRLLKEERQKTASCEVELNKQKEEKGELLAEVKKLKDRNAKADNSMLEEENKLLLAQLHLLQDELGSMHRGTKPSAKKREVKSSGVYYGAGERVKRQLTYRLGATVVKSKGVKDYFLLPYRLKKAHADYKRDVKKRAGERLPPINQYADAHEAERVKRHLSYRLGRVIMKHANTPIGLLKLPFLLSKEAKAFRLERQR